VRVGELADQPDQVLAQCGERGHGRRSRADRLGRPVHPRRAAVEEELFLRAEVVEHRLHRHVGLGGDLGDGHRLEAVGLEEAPGDAADLGTSPGLLARATVREITHSAYYIDGPCSMQA
jgi:hypothetical protein